MPTALIDRAAELEPTEVGRPAPARHTRAYRIVAAALLVAGVGALAYQLRAAHLGSVMTHLQPWQLAIAVACIALSILAAAYNLTGFSALHISLRRSLLAQLAISGLRVVTPSAVSTPAVAIRFLTRSGASFSDATTTVGAAQGVQLLATAAILAVLAAMYGTQGPGLPHTEVLGWAAVAVAVATAAVLVGARFSWRVRATLLGGRASLARLATHVRTHPRRVLRGVLASVLLTLTHVFAFAACVSAAGGHLPLVTLTLIYLGGTSAGSLLPTPGGIGAVEAALIAGLTAAGTPVSVATAATLVSRLIAVWLPAAPGWWALLRLRRAQLL